MRKILNYFTGVIITFLFLIFNDLDAIPSKYRLGIAAVILILLILRIGHLSQECKFVIAGVVVCYIIISIIYNHKKKVEFD